MGIDAPPGMDARICWKRDVPKKYKKELEELGKKNASLEGGDDNMEEKTEGAKTERSGTAASMECNHYVVLHGLRITCTENA